VTLTAPEPITVDHDTTTFDSGRPVLDDWLRQRALKNQSSDASRTYVVCEGTCVVGYYCISAGSVAQKGAPRKIKRNMPDPIPVMVIGRLAVDKTAQGNGLGQALLRDAILRTLGVSQVAGIKALLVHALDEEAAAFYHKYDFVASPIDSLTLMLPLETARRGISG